MILSALIIIYLISIIIYYNINKMFPHYNSHITRFVISFLIPILLSPSCCNIGFSFNAIFLEDIQISIDPNITATNITIDLSEYSSSYLSKQLKWRPLFIASVVFGAVFLALLAAAFYVDVMFRSSTPYIEDTPLSMWDGFPLFMILFGSSLTNLFSVLMARMPEWARSLLAACCVLWNAACACCLLSFPMVKKWMNTAVFALVASGVVASFCQLLPVPAACRLAAPLASLAAVCAPLSLVLFRVVRRKVESADVEEADFSRDWRALRWIRLAIGSRCEEFVSFKWLKKANQAGSARVISQAAQVIAFFPSESQNLKFYISLLSKKSDLSLHQRFLFGQLRRVHVLRQSNTSKQLNEDLREITKATGQAIQCFQQFLIRTIDERQELTVDRLNYLAHINRATNSLCREAISRYPNNSRLLFLFSQYVIECQADFKGGIALYQEGQSIERGRRAVVDYAFRSMINLFPSYLYKRILDYKGNNILNRRRAKSGSSMSVDSITNDRNNAASDTDIESNEKIASSVIENPKIRFALRKAVNKMSSTGITILTASSVFRFLLSFVICIIIYAFSSSFLDDRKINYQNIAQIGQVRKSLDLTLFRLAKLWAVSIGLTPSLSDLNTSLGPGISLSDYHGFSEGGGPRESLFSDAYNSIAAIERLGQLLIEIKYEESMNIFDKSTSDFVQMSNISFCNSKTQSIIQSTTSLRYFSLYLLNQAIHAMHLGKDADWKGEDCICEIILNMNNVVNILNDQSNVLVSQEEELSDTLEKGIVIFFCVAVPVAFAAFLAPFVVGFVKMNVEFHQIFDVLSLLPIKIYKEASKPIALFTIESDQPQDGVAQQEYKSCQKVTTLIPTILSTAIITGILIGVFILIKDSNSKFYTLVKWLEIGSGRAPLLIETVTNALCASIFGYLGEADYTDVVYHLEMVFNYSQLLLYQHKTLIWGDDSSKSCNNFSERLDALHFTNTCAISMQATHFQMSYACMCLDQQIMTFNKFAKDVYLTLLYAWYNGNLTDGGSGHNNAFLNILNGYEMTNMHYLGITHMLPRLEAAQEILDEGINLRISQLDEYSLLIALITLAAELILFLADVLIIGNLRREYDIVRILIARLPPLSVAKNQSLVELMTGQINGRQAKKLDPVRIHIKNCTNSLIAFDRQCKIKLTNTATSETFGVSKEQLYNASLAAIISADDVAFIREKCAQNIESKKSKREETQERSAGTQSVDDSKSTMLSSLLDKSDADNIDLNTAASGAPDEKADLYSSPVQMTLVGMKDDGTKMILSAVLTYVPEPDDVYALILNDETKIYVNEEEVKRAKQRTEDIICQVLPPPIAQQGRLHENISFSIKQVTVITIKILNFIDSIQHITSVQAIRNMSELFTLFDTQLMNYPNLTKTMVISESYQAVGGLFNPASIKKFSSRDDSMNLVIDPARKDDDEYSEYESTRGPVSERPSGRATESSAADSTAAPGIPPGSAQNDGTASGAAAASGGDASGQAGSGGNDAGSPAAGAGSFSSSIGPGIDGSNFVSNFNSHNYSNLSTEPASSARPKERITQVRSRKSLYDIRPFNIGKSVLFTSIVLDSISFAFDCLNAVESLNANAGTNHVIAVGINAGGPVTAGTLGEEHIQFEIIGGTVKESYIICNAAEGGSVVVSSEIFELIKDSQEAQQNIAFAKYKKVGLLHFKKTDTFVLKPLSSMNNGEGGEEEVIVEEEEDMDDGPQDVPLDSQAQRADELSC